MDSLIKAINQYPNGTQLIVEWPNGCIVLGEIDTIYDSDDEEETGENYKVIYVCVFQVVDILNHSTEKEHFEKGDLIEVADDEVYLRNPHAILRTFLFLVHELR